MVNVDEGVIRNNISDACVNINLIRDRLYQEIHLGIVDLSWCALFMGKNNTIFRDMEED